MNKHRQRQDRQSDSSKPRKHSLCRGITRAIRKGNKYPLQLFAKILLFVTEYHSGVTCTDLTLSQTSPGFYVSVVQVF